MDLSEQMSGQLAMIATLTEVANRYGSRAWLRGGWGMDFALGRITRFHEDVDVFIDAAHYSDVVGALVEEGWTITNPQSMNMQANMVFKGETAHLTPIAHRDLRDPHVPEGPWAGSRWPETTLSDAGKGTIAQVCAWYSSVSSQIECKQATPGWMGRPPREKDLDDLIQLRGIAKARRTLGFGMRTGKLRP